MGTALITGASAGIGAELAKIFADHGHDLVLVARRKERLDEIARALKGIHTGLRVTVIEQDLAKPGAGAALFSKVQEPVDFLVNNAGFGTGGAFGSRPLARELELIDLNVRTLVELTYLFLAPMRARGAGRILQVGSTAGFQAGPYLGNYYASKAYVNHFSEALQEELRGTGVTCTVLCPGATATEFAGAAGLTESALFRLFAVSPVGVARAGYEGMMRGKTMVIPGVQNWLQVQSVRLAPRWLARRIAGMLNRSA